MKLLDPRSTMMTLASATLLGAATLGPATAGTVCKGLEQAQCGTTADCIWIDAYQRKDGKQVAGYCKAKGKPAGTGTQDQAPPPAAKPAPKDAPPAPR